jgi:hypothetical protein
MKCKIDTISILMPNMHISTKKKVSSVMLRRKKLKIKNVITVKARKKKNPQTNVKWSQNRRV